MPKFQKRHYEAIADVIADARLTANGASAADKIEAGLATLFAKDNPRFKPQRFYRACRWQPNRLAAVA